MDIRQLRYFVGVVNSGSFSDAAVHMHVAQSALSRHVKSLEQTVGGELLERHPKGVTPTRLGWRLYEQASRAVAHVESIPSRIREEDYRITGRVTLGAPSSIARDLFPSVAEAVAPRFPGIEVDFVEGNAISLGGGLDAGDIDLAVMVDPDRRLEFDYEPIFSERMYLFGRRGDPEFPAGPIKISDLPKYPLALPSRRNGPRKIIDQALFKSNVSLNIRYEVSGTGIIDAFIRRGLAMGVLSHSMLTPGAAPGGLQAVPVDKLAVVTVLVSNRELAATPHTNAVMEIVREQAMALPETERFSDARAIAG